MTDPNEHEKDAPAEAAREHRSVFLVGRDSSEREAFLAAIRPAIEMAGVSAVVLDESRQRSPAPAMAVAVDGWGRLTLLEALAAISGMYPGTPVLAVVSDRSPLGPLLDAGFADCARWPVDPSELAARIRARLRDPRDREAARISIDTLRFTVQCNRVVVHLTPGEFRVFKVLLDAPNQWITSRVLVASLSAPPRAGSKSIASRIHAIRKKLAHEAWRLRGHRWRGYLFATSPRLLDDDRASKKE